MERVMNILVRDVHNVSLINDMFMHVSFARGIQGTYKAIMLQSLACACSWHITPQLSGTVLPPVVVVLLKGFRV